MSLFLVFDDYLMSLFWVCLIDSLESHFEWVSVFGESLMSLFESFKSVASDVLLWVIYKYLMSLLWVYRVFSEYWESYTYSFAVFNFWKSLLSLCWVFNEFSMSLVFEESSRSLQGVFEESLRSLWGVYEESSRSLQGVFKDTLRSLRGVIN